MGSAIAGAFGVEGTEGPKVEAFKARHSHDGKNHFAVREGNLYCCECRLASGLPIIPKEGY